METTDSLQRCIDSLPDSEPPEEVPPVPTVKKGPEVAAQDPPSSQLAPDTPPPNSTSNSHKKGGRPPNARKGKLGKNQYTKDRDLQHEGDGASPGRSQSRDVTRNDENGVPSARGSINEGKPTKSRNGGSKVTLFDAKRRAAAIHGFIVKTQLEMASEPVSSISSGVAGKSVIPTAEGLPTIKVNGTKGDESQGSDLSNGSAALAEREFKALPLLEMMDVLTRNVVKWQEAHN